MNFMKQKKKSKKWTIQDCKDFFDENLEYRYVVLVGKDKTPYSMCKTIQEAKEDEEVYYMAGGKFPTEIIDLLF